MGKASRPKVKKGTEPVFCAKCGTRTKGWQRSKIKKHNLNCSKRHAIASIVPRADVFRGTNIQVKNAIDELVSDIKVADEAVVLKYDDELRIKPCSSSVPSVVYKFARVRSLVEAMVKRYTNSKSARMYTSSSKFTANWAAMPKGTTREQNINSFIPWIRRYKLYEGMEIHQDPVEDGAADRTWSCVVCTAGNGEALKIGSELSFEPHTPYNLFPGDFVIFKSTLYHQAPAPTCRYRTVFASMMLCD